LRRDTLDKNLENEIKAMDAVAQLKASWETQLEVNMAIAKMYKALYDAFIKEGFTSYQALTLTIERMKSAQ
jgi:hypothetical protein